MMAAVVSSIFNMEKPDAARPSIMIAAVVLIIFDITNILLAEFVCSFLLRTIATNVELTLKLLVDVLSLDGTCSVSTHIVCYQWALFDS
jgi:hypothetical protein